MSPVRYVRSYTLAKQAESEATISSANIFEMLQETTETTRIKTNTAEPWCNEGPKDWQLKYVR